MIFKSLFYRHYILQEDNMEKSLKNFTPGHEYLVCIDSDGCAFDVMEVKHKECFCPAAINFWDLQAVSRYAREDWDYVNLYSSERGINRFIALEHVLTLLSQRDEIMDFKEFHMPDYRSLTEWINSGEPLNNQSLEHHQNDETLVRTLAWSLDCNRRIKEMVRNVPPFSFVRESLAELSAHADIVIVSATSAEALYREWTEHDLLPYVSAVCGQEDGSKQECIRTAARSYTKEKCMMIGDAPGDLKAARQNGILFYPILPLKERTSWVIFYKTVLKAFLSGTYQSEFEEGMLTEFRSALPDVPPWKKGSDPANDSKY